MLDLFVKLIEINGSTRRIERIYNGLLLTDIGILNKRERFDFSYAEWYSSSPYQINITYHNLFYEDTIKPVNYRLLSLLIGRLS